MKSKPAGLREWLGLAVLALPAVLASLELTVTHLALPAIGADLEAGATEQLWVVDIYAFLLAGSLITIGTLGDRIGRRRLLLSGATAYGVMSVLAATSPSPELLIVARAGMGLAGATLMPSTLALITTMFSRPRDRVMAISVIVSCVSAGTAIGPLVGGWVLEHYWWGSVFLLGVPVMGLLLVAGPLLLPEHRAVSVARIDISSVALSMVAVLPLVYGLKQVAADGPTGSAMVAVGVGAAGAAAFAHRQRRLRDPLIDLSLFQNSAVRIAVVTLAVGIFVLWAINYAVAQYLQLVHGLSPLVAGMWTAPSAVGVIAGSILAVRLVRSVQPGRVIAYGLVISTAGFAVLTQLQGLPILVVGTITVSAGLGPMMALATDLIIKSAPVEHAGMASSISSISPQLGGAFGIAVLGSVITATYRQQMAVAIPSAVPADVRATAEDSLAGAVAHADTLGVTTLDAARDAFTAGVHLIALVSAVLLAVLTAGWFRKLGTHAPEQQAERR